MKRTSLSRRTFIKSSSLALAAAAPLAGAAENAGSTPTPDKLTYRGLFMHAWDLRDDGIDDVMGWMRDSGLNAMCMAGTYHSGWFVHPNNSKHRSYLTEGSVCYFHPKEAAKTRIRPVISQVSRDTDWFAEASRRLDKYGLRLVSWTIGTHNTRLGVAHPEHTQRNVYGDSIPHGLCPADDDVRAYLKAICRDLAVNYQMWGVQLESFGWLGFTHGHHHERDLTGLTPLEQQLMALCICPACTRKAGAAGIEVGQVREIIKGLLDATFREAPDRPVRHPRSMEELEGKSKDLRAFNAWRKTVADSLISEIKREALKGTSCRLLMQTGYQPEVAAVADGFACGAYGKSPAETLEICKKAKAALPPDWRGELQCYVRLGLGVPANAAELRGLVAAVREGGCTGVNFYNRSESPPRMLSWLKGAFA